MNNDTSNNYFNSYDYKLKLSRTNKLWNKILENDKHKKIIMELIKNDTIENIKTELDEKIKLCIVSNNFIGLQWLCSYFNPSMNKYASYFKFACVSNCLDIAKWLYNTHIGNLYVLNCAPLYMTPFDLSEHHYLGISDCNTNIHKIARDVRRKNHTEVEKWLVTLDKSINYDINKNILARLLNF